MTSRAATLPAHAGRRGYGAGRRVPVGPTLLTPTKDSPMTPSHDEQVAAFRADLEGLTAFDAEQIHDDVQNLTTAMRTAPTHDLAAVAVRDFYDSRAHDPIYARAIIASALSLLATTILIAERLHDLPGPDGLLARLQRLSVAVRAVGVGIDQLRHMYGGA